MLKFNESVIKSVSTDLENCEKNLFECQDGIEAIITELTEHSALEEERAQLKRLVLQTETTQRKIKALSHVLNYALLQYTGSENSITANAAATETDEKSKLRIRLVDFDIPYAEIINWKRG